jgi:MFS family permease
MAWPAIELAPEAHRGTWVAFATAAYVLPGAAGALLLGRFLRHRSPTQLASWDAVLRACMLGAIPVVYAFGVLSIGAYVALLAASSVLHSWGQAGIYALLARLLPDRDQLAGNAVLSTLGSFATVVGPALAGALIGWGGAAAVIAVDAVTFAILAATFRFAIPAIVVAGAEPVRGDAARATGFGVIRGDRTLVGLLALSFGFFFLFGPVYVALPLHVQDDLHGSASTLGAFYSAFGVGAVVGGLLTGYLRRWPMWPTTIGIVIGFGAFMLPIGFGAPTLAALATFAVAGLLWPPYSSLSTTLFQHSAAPALLPQVLAAASAARR